MEEALYRRLEALGIKIVVKEHPPVFTVEQAKRLRGSIRGAHCKNLFLRDKKRNLFLLSCLEDREFELKSLRAPLGARAGVSFASPELLTDRLGVSPGAVTPFAIINDIPGGVRVALDEGFRQASLLNFHPLRNDRTVSIRPGDLERFLVDADHSPIWVDFDRLAPSSRPLAE